MKLQMVLRLAEKEKHSRRQDELSMERGMVNNPWTSVQGEASMEWETIRGRCLRRAFRGGRGDARAGGQAIA